MRREIVRGGVVVVGVVIVAVVICFAGLLLSLCLFGPNELSDLWVLQKDALRRKIRNEHN